MYITQVDTALSETLDLAYGIISEGEPIGGVSWGSRTEEIDRLLQQIYDEMNLDSVQRQIGRIRAAQRVAAVFRQYVAIYLMLYIGYHDDGDLAVYRNNLVQYASLHRSRGGEAQLTPEVIYQLVQWREKIQVIRQYLPLAELGREAMIGNSPGAEFVRRWGEEYVQQHLVAEGEVQVHNLLKTVVFGDLYQATDREDILLLLQESEEDRGEYIYIQIVTSNDIYRSLEAFSSLWPADPTSQRLAAVMWQEGAWGGVAPPSVESWWRAPGSHPIVQDWLRYHRDTSQVGDSRLSELPGYRDLGSDRAEDTRASIIVREIDAISERWSAAIRSQEANIQAIERLFEHQLQDRQAVFHNHTEEMLALDRIISAGPKEMDQNEYYLDLDYIVRHAYFNYRTPDPHLPTLLEYRLRSGGQAELLRYCNLQFQEQHRDRAVDWRPAEVGTSLSVVGQLRLPLQWSGVPTRGQLQPTTWETLRDQTIARLTSGVTVTGETYPVLQRDDRQRDVPLYVTEGLTEEGLLQATEMLRSAYLETAADLLRQVGHRTWHYAASTLHHWLSYAQIPRTSDLIVLYLRRYYLPVSLPREVRPGPTPQDQIHYRYQAPVQPPLRLIEIDLRNPVLPIPYLDVEAEAQLADLQAREGGASCRHELDWRQIRELADGPINDYNQALEQFLQTYAIHTLDQGYVCKICSAVLPVAPEVVTSWSSSSYYVSYIPPRVELSQVEEYVDYEPLIEAVGSLVRRVSQMAGIRVFIGNDEVSQTRRVSLIKSVLDLTIAHNRTSLESPAPDPSVYGVRPSIDSVYYFRVDPSMLQDSFGTQITDETQIRIKRDNLLLYFMYVFLTELSPGQVIHMTHTSRTNIHTYLKVAPRLFRGLRVRTSINDPRTIEVTEWPVFCYLLYVYSYNLSRYRLWQSTASTRQGYDPGVQIAIVHSMIHLINDVSYQAGRHPDHYVYRQSTHQFYSNVYPLFRNAEVMEMLGVEHSRYDRGLMASSTPQVTPLGTLPLAQYESVETLPMPYPSYTRRGWYPARDLRTLVYPIAETLDARTVCEDGQYYHWQLEGGQWTDTRCGMRMAEVPPLTQPSESRRPAVYQRSLRQLADHYCPDGYAHQMDAEGTCTRCGYRPGSEIPPESLLRLAEGWRAKRPWTQPIPVEDPCLGYTLPVWDGGLLEVLLSILGAETQVGVEGVHRLPIYLDDDLYAIRANHLGKPLETPATYRHSERQFTLVPDHPHYGTAVYSYTNRKAGVDVYYDMVTLQQLGYKPHQGEYATVEGVELSVVPSVRDQLRALGWKDHYRRLVDVSPAEMTGLLRSALDRLRRVVDRARWALWAIYHRHPGPRGTRLHNLVLRYGDLDWQITDGDWTPFADWDCVWSALQQMPLVDLPETHTSGVWRHVRLSSLAPAMDVIRAYLESTLVRVLSLPANAPQRVLLAQMMVDIILLLHSETMTRGSGDALSQRYAYVVTSYYVVQDDDEMGSSVVEMEDQDRDSKEVDVTQYYSSDDLED